MQWHRSDYLDLMTFGHCARPMFVELFGPLVGLEQEWRRQGASPDELNLTAFDFDFVPIHACGGDTHPLATPPITLQETDDCLLQRDFLGRTLKLWKKTATLPLPMDFPVKTMDDWLRLKPLFTFRQDRINTDQIERAKAAQRDGALIVAPIPGAYDMVRELMGEEMAALASYDQPELLDDILHTLADTAWQVLEPISRTLAIDQLSIHEDFAGRSGPLAGPAQIRQFFKPYYRRIWELLAARGARIFQQDTDGNINPVLDDLLACGLNSIFPMEPAAGMDTVKIRQRYGRRLAMLGGIDKHVLRQDHPAIRRELEYKLQPLMVNQGGIVFGLDHRIPNGTPLDNYRFYVDTAREILHLPPRTADKKGWQRMAF